MSNRQLHTAISASRFARYLNACDGDRKKALKLYRLNIIASQKIYAVLGVFEVVLRNAIDRHYLQRKGDDWLAHAVLEGGYLDLSPECEHTYHTIQEALHKLITDNNYSHDNLVAKLSFGFWAYQFGKKEFAASGSTLLGIFLHRPFGTHQKMVFQHLIRINEIRNRIAHHEPICFDKKTGRISSRSIIKIHELIKEMLRWLGYDPGKILYGIDGVRKIIALIDAFAGEMG